jgi:histidine triad (HIT) family protein
MQRDSHKAGCTFCDLIKGAAEVSICHEDSDSIAFMDIQPVNNGHVLVVPRAHYESIFEVPAELGQHIFKVTMSLTGAVRKVTGCEDINIVVSSGEAAGQDEPHYHVHISPRRVGDGFDIPLPFGGSEMPDRTLLDAYAARILSALRDPMRVSAPGEGPPTSGAARREPTSRTKADAREDSRHASAERSVAVPTFDEPEVKADEPPAEEASDETQDAPPVYLSMDEGPHGELHYDAGQELRAEPPDEA